MTLVVMIQVIARKEGLDPKEGGRIVASIIAEELE
jgi:hypothetical protein